MSKELLEQIGGEVKGIAEATTKQSAAFNEVKADVEASKKDMAGINEAIKKQQEHLDNLTSAVQRSGVKGEAKERAELEIKYCNMFGDFMRGNVQAGELKSIVPDYKNALIEVATKNGDFATVNELKTLSTDKIATGGALVPVQMANAIVEKQRDFSDVRQYATVERSDTTGLIFPGEAADFGFGWVGERENRSTEDGGEFYDVEIPVMEARAKVGVTNKMRMNGAFDLNSYITRRAAQRLARGEGAAFVSGDGFKKPKGFMTYPAGTADGQVQQIETLGSNVLAGDDLINLKTPLRSSYRRNARYYMNRFTEGAVEKLKDDQGNYLFNRGDLAKGTPSTIKGFPTHLFDDMAGANENDGSLADNELIMLFGDLAEFYTIVDHTTSMLMFIDPYTGADDGKVFFRFHKFVGGGVTNFEAAKILKVKA